MEPGPRGNTGVDISGGGREARVRLIFGGLEDGGHQSRVWAGFIHSRGSVTGGTNKRQGWRTPESGLGMFIHSGGSVTGDKPRNPIGVTRSEIEVGIWGNLRMERHQGLDIRGSCHWGNRGRYSDGPVLYWEEYFEDWTETGGRRMATGRTWRASVWLCLMKT